MRRPAFICVTLALALSGCQVMPQVFSDLRTLPRPGESPEQADSRANTAANETASAEEPRSRILSASGEPVRTTAESRTVPDEPVAEIEISQTRDSSGRGQAAQQLTLQEPLQEPLQETLQPTLQAPVNPAETARLETQVEGSESSALSLEPLQNGVDQRAESAEQSVALVTPAPATQAPIGTDSVLAPPQLIQPLPWNAALTNNLNWQIDLTDPLNRIDAQLLETTALDEKIQILMASAFLIDAQLYVIFRDLTDRLPEPVRADEIEQQRVWLDERKAALTRAFLEFEDEKAARYNAAQAFVRESKKRMSELTAQLNALN